MVPPNHPQAHLLNNNNMQPSAQQLHVQQQHAQQQQRALDSPGVGHGGDFGQVPWPGQLPSLHLYPLSDSFVPKQIHLPPNTHMRIGRQTNAKSVPGERNGYFDSKVLSRTHAEVWQEDGKVYIKDVKSSNGTFVNGERLSPEATESEPYELKSEDHLEFGIDIVGEDNKTVVHHKVSSKAFVVFTQQDVEASARELQAYQQAMARFAMRRGNQKPSGPNVNDLTRQIANELQKSRETAQDLHILHSAMNDIHDTLGGGNAAPSTSSMHPSYPQPHGPHPETTEDLASLRAQLADTQTLISSSVTRVISLEGRLHEQENVRREVEELRERLAMLASQVDYRSRLEEDTSDDDDEETPADDDEDEQAQDDDDTRSISTVKASPRARRNGGGKQQQQQQRARIANGRSISAEDGDGDDDDASLAARDESEADHADEHERGRPVTPEPGFQPREASAPRRLRAADPERTNENDDDNEDNDNDESEGLLKQQLAQQLADTQRVLAHNTTLVARLDTLHSELDGVLEASRSLRNQHESALSTVTLLESRVAELEGKVTEAESKWAVWKQTMEATWRRERESWDSERERMKSVVKEWEEAKRRAEEEEEERRLNEEEGPDDLGWMADGDAGRDSGEDSRSASSSDGGPSDGGEGGGTIQGGQARFLARHGYDRSGSPTPNASPDTKGRYSSLRHLLNPLGGGASAGPARKSVPSGFLRQGAAVDPTSSGATDGRGAADSSTDSHGADPNGGSAGSPPSLRQSTSASTIKAPSVAAAGRSARDVSGRRVAESATDALAEESDGRPTTGRSDLAAPAAVVAPPLSLSPTQLQGFLVVGVAVALAINYDRLVGLVRS